MAGNSIDGIRAQLCPPLPEETLELDDLKRLVDCRISDHMPKFEKAIGLEHPTRQFREDVIRGILYCILTHHFRPKRRSVSRERLLRVSKEAAVAANAIRRAAATFEEITPVPPGLGHFTHLGEQASQFDALSSVTGRLAESLVADKGGPQGMIAYRTLVRGLATAFENATGRAAKAKWNIDHARFEGPFVNLMEAVLPITLKLVSGMAHPSSEHARGKFIHRVTSVRRRPSPR
jgi:hypothetical protein